MNADTYITYKQSICATCLSRDRKLFSVNNLQLFTNFFSKLSLVQTDKVCWECRNMMLRMVTFLNRARKAQAWLESYLKYEEGEFPCLSTLGISKPFYLTNNDLEILKHTNSDVTVSKYVVPINEYINVDNEKREDNGSDIIIKEEIEVEIEVDVEDLNDEEHTNATFSGLPIKTEQLSTNTMINMGPSKNLTNRMRLPINVMHNIDHNYADLKQNSNSIRKFKIMRDTEVPATKLRKVLPGTEKMAPTKKVFTKVITKTTPAEPDHIYTEEPLDEEGLVKWRERKRAMDCFTSRPSMSRCDMCIEPFYTQKRFLKHAKLHTEVHGNIECDICKQRVATQEYLESHRKLHYRILKCRYCNYVWDDVNNMREHCYDVHLIEQTAWDCEPCKRQFPTKVKLQKHFLTHLRVKCDECGMQMAPLSLKHHMTVAHRGGNPLHTCELCGKKFRGLVVLRNHMKKHSPQEDPNAYCAECNVRFRDMTELKRHLRHGYKHVDKSVFRYACDICSQRFKTAINLENHKLKRHSQLNQAYRCDICDQTYKTKSGRRTHVLKRHEGRVQPKDKLCEHCGRGFNSKAELSSHMNTHTGARPFVCKVCGADFGHKSALYLHGRYKHDVKGKDGKPFARKGGERKVKSKKDTGKESE